MAAPDPELDVAGAAMVAEGARFVVIGGFAVIANRFVRATEDIDFLVPDDEENDRRVLAALLSLGGVRHRDSEPLRPEHLILPFPTSYGHGSEFRDRRTPGGLRRRGSVGACGGCGDRRVQRADDPPRVQQRPPSRLPRRQRAGGEDPLRRSARLDDARTGCGEAA